MASLTETAYLTRRIIKFGAIGLVSFIALRAILINAIAYYKKLNPPPPPPPTVAFQYLEKIPFPEQEEKKLKYTLQLPTAEFPEFSDRAKVFLMPYKRSTFSVWDEARKQASGLGFKNEPEAITSQVYRWSIKSPVLATLEMNIIDGSFEYEYSWNDDPSILNGRNLLGEKQAIQETKNFLEKARNIDNDIVNAEAKVFYIKATGNRLTPAVSLSEADFVQVDLFRANIDDMPVMTPNPAKGIISSLISGASHQRFLKVVYNHFPINYSLPATYPIKNAQQAWQELIEKKGYIASFNGNEEVVVRRVYLGFYDSYEPQTYLQPIFIFTGDEDFVGYVPAIIDEWYR